MKYTRLDFPKYGGLWYHSPWLSYWCIAWPWLFLRPWHGYLVISLN